MRHSLMPKSLLRIAITIVLMSAMSGCGLGVLASAPWIRSADNNDVVVIGDSIFALSGRIQERLHGFAGGTFRNYATSGAQLVVAGSLGPSVAAQYAMAKSDPANSTVVLMNGGGNDILIPAILFDPHNCKTQWWEWGRLSRRCKSFIDELYIDGVNFLNQMHADGVTDVVYLGYYHTKNGLFWLDSLEEAVDYGDRRLSAACSNSAADCTFIDPRSTIRDRDILFDGIHPKTTGSDKLADLIWPVLQTKL